MNAHSTTATHLTNAGFLRLALMADGAVTTVNGLGYLVGFAVLHSWLGLPTGVLIAVGAFLAVYGALVWRLATRPAMPVAAVVTVIAANALWAADSLLALAFDWFSPTLAGQIVIAVQAVGVAALAALQYMGLRRA